LNVKVSRQFPLTLTLQWFASFPFRGCSPQPGTFMSDGSRATFSAASSRANFGACAAEIPALLPVLKNRSTPLWRKDLITEEV